jgi:plasmid stabilization system protein ParE
LIRVIWSDGALVDLAQHTRCVANFNPRSAIILAQELRTSAQNLQLFPRHGRPGLVENTRELIAVWPYVIAYRITGQSLEILRIWHGAQERERE